VAQIKGCHGLIKNCTIADIPDGIEVMEGGTCTIENSIVYHRASVFVSSGATLNISYCDLQGGLNGIEGGGTVNWGPGNIDTDPFFVRLGRDSETQGDYHLLSASPCIDAGDTGYVPGPNETDLDGNPRIVNSTVDMGAYEFQDIHILYVDSDAPQFGNGTSWATAFKHLQDALFIAIPPAEIRVAEGIYKPHLNTYILAPSSRADTFQLKNGIVIKGGYAGLGQPDPDARDISLYVTILSGDMNGDDTAIVDPRSLLTEPSRADNSYHVVTASGTDSTAILDGFTITGGYAHGDFDYSDPRLSGGGIYSFHGSATVSNCIFRANSAKDEGGGLWSASNAELTLTNCTFINNAVGNQGGGIYFSLDYYNLINCKFQNNFAYGSGGGIYSMDCYGLAMVTHCKFTGNTAEMGGGMAISEDTIVFTGCLFSGNRASYTGGGLDCFDSTPTLINCTFSQNSAGYEGGGITTEGTTKISNCIFWDNRTGGIADESAQIHGGSEDINYSCVQGWTGIRGGTGNISDDPLFDSAGHWDDAGTPVDPADDIWIDGNYHLQPDSPCIDAGDNTAVPPYLTVDLNGNPRFVDDPETVDTGRGTPPIVDMGAYEGHGQGLVIDPRSPTVAEGGTGTFNVALAMDPHHIVEVTVVHQSGDQDITIQSAATLSFDSSNYDQSQTVTLAAVEDDDNVAGTAVIHLSATGLPPAFVTAREVDNEPVTRVLYVDAGASGVTGTSWQDAYPDLQVALAVAAQSPQVEQILVAEGVYKPAGSSGNRTATFRLRNGLGVYGGFPTGGGDWVDRDPAVYETILSGDLAGNDAPVADPAELSNEPTRAENCYHVVTLRNTDNTALLDGVVISGGYADGWEYLDRHEGGGVYLGNANSKMTDCFLRDNYSSSVYTVGGSPTLSGCSFYANDEAIRTWESSPALTDCAFFDNIRAMSIRQSKPTLTDCTFSHNGVGATYSEVVFVGCTFAENQNALSLFLSDINLTACTFRGNSRRDGGAIYSHVGGYVTATNCLFVGNSATDDYGAVDAPATLTNCTFVGNSAGDRYGAVGSVTLANCIFWGNSDRLGTGELSQIGYPVDIRHCNVQGWTGIYGGIGNFGADPLFVDTGYRDVNGVWIEGDYHLLFDSPCKDTGDNTVVPPSLLTDLDGKPRIIGGTVDIGAYEFWGPVYVDDDGPNDPGPGDPAVSDPLEDGTETHPFDTIQEGINLAVGGYTVLVRQGSYFEPAGGSTVDFLGKNITLKSENPTDWDIVDNTVIRSYVQFSGTEDPNCKFAGFKIRNLEGAIYGNHTHATIS
ncbi:MAG: right-handed parallel beta-helix repeat-containing protein, partial [Planctomycetota bacterium]